MTFNVDIVQDTLHPSGKKRLTSLVLKYPRFIHAELMTHRAFSRSASSSRAIPVRRIIEGILDDPAFFVHIGKNQPGMQASEEVDEPFRVAFKREWETLAEINAEYSRRWSELYGIHKQVANRNLEPWMHMTTIVTATDFDNHRTLRYHKDAQPEYRHLAEMWHRAMDEALEANTPVVRRANRLSAEGWHLPFILDAEREKSDEFPILLAKSSAARSARVSYANHDGSNPVIEKDLGLFADLMASEPLHASPAEHQGYVVPSENSRCKNFSGGFGQFRHLVEHATHYGQVLEDYVPGNPARGRLEA